MSFKIAPLAWKLVSPYNATKRQDLRLLTLTGSRQAHKMKLAWR
jgi:hypothetical protein